MSDFSKLNMVDMPQLNLTPTLNACQSIQAEMEANLRNASNALAATQRERERNEREQRENIRRIADNSEDTVNALKETNELLRQNNELLKRENESLSGKLDEINKILGNLFDLEEENGEEQKELLQQALALAVQIDMSITQNGKFDWKGTLANTTTTGLFMGLQVYLHSKGLL